MTKLAMTPEQLDDKEVVRVLADRFQGGYTRMLLTLPPDQLSRAVAEAIQACRKEKV